MLSKALFVLSSLCVTINASASNTTSAPIAFITGIFEPCVVGCAVPAAAQNGCTVTELSCLCTRGQFQADVLGCLQQNCPVQLSTALAYMQAQCSALNLTVTATPTTSRAVSFSQFGGGTHLDVILRPNSSSITTSIPTSSASNACTSLHAGDLSYIGAVLAVFFAL